MERGREPAARADSGATINARMALGLIRKQIASGEEIQWCAEPDRQIMLRHLIYRAVVQWLLFTCILPMTPEIIVLTIVFMAYLAFIEYRRNCLGVVYAITGTRVLVGRMRADKTLKLQEQSLSRLASVKRAPLTKTLTLKFRGGGPKVVTLPYLAESDEPMDICRRRL